MHAVSLNELKAVPKISVQEGQSDVAYKTSVESSAQDDDFRQI
jgi:hypothetical protein